MAIVLAELGVTASRKRRPIARRAASWGRRKRTGDLDFGLVMSEN